MRASDRGDERIAARRSVVALRWLAWVAAACMLGDLTDSRRISLAVEPPAGSFVLYVAPGGDDRWSGSLPEPNADRSDGPLRSLVRARDVLRARRAGGAPEVPATVSVRGGTFLLSEPLRLTPEDSGTAAAPIHWEAYSGETPVLDAGERLRGWERVEAGASIQPRARGHVWSAPITADRVINQLFVAGRRLPRAAWPSGDVWEQWPQASGREGSRILRVPVEGIEPPLPSQAEINIVPGPASRYVNAILPVKEIDAAGRVRVGVNLPDAVGQGALVRLENFLAGIREPGQWCIEGGRVYLWPPGDADPNRLEIVAPRLIGAIELLGDEASGKLVTFVHVRGFEVVHVDRGRAGDPEPPGGRAGLDTNDAAIVLSGVEDCSVVECRLRHLGGMGIRAFGHAKRLRIAENEIADCGGTGIAVQGGAAGTLRDSVANRVVANHVHDCGTIYWHGVGVAVAMSEGAEVIGNVIDHMPYGGILVTGQHTLFFRRAKGRPAAARSLSFRWDEIGDDPLTIESVKRFIPGGARIEGNVVRDVMRVLDDGGGIHLWGSHDDVVRDNLVDRCERPFSFGIYLDDEELGATVTGNLVRRCPDSRSSVIGAALLLHHSGRAVVRGNALLSSGRPFRFRRAYGGVRMSGNVLVFGEDPVVEEGPETGGEFRAGESTIDGNLLWWEGRKVDFLAFLKAWRGRGWDRHSTVADPRLTEAPSGAVTFEHGSPVEALGIARTIPARRTQDDAAH